MNAGIEPDILHVIHKFRPDILPSDILQSIFNNHTLNSPKPNSLISAVVTVHIGSVIASRYNCIHDGMGIVYSSLIFDVIGESGAGKSTILKIYSKRVRTVRA
jgi:hypothetical protein